MKTKLLSLFIATALTGFFNRSINAQNTFPLTGSAGIGTTAPDASAILEMKSTTKGLLIPRMTSPQRNAIVSPATGLLVYQIKGGAQGFYFYDGSSWNQLKGANTSLSNLAPSTSVNADLIANTNNLYDLGSSSNGWKNLFLSGSIYFANTRGLYTVGNNSAVGLLSLNNNTTGSYNTAGGYRALFANTSGYGNTAIGSQAFSTTYSITPSDGINNTGLGVNAGSGNTTGSYNVAIGNVTTLADTLSSSVQSFSTTLVGYAALVTRGGASGGVSFGTAIGSGARLYGDNSTAIGANAIATANNQVMLGNTSVTSVKAAGSFVIYSDGRFKKNIKSNVPGLDFINELKPVTYNYDIHKLNDFIKQANENNTLKNKTPQDEKIQQLNEEAINAKEKKIYSGFVAQDVEKTAEKFGYDFSGLYKPQNAKDPYGLSYADFVVPLVKAVQELSKINEEKDAKINDLETRLAKVEQLLQQNNDRASSTVSSANIIINSTSLEQNIPNPFNHTTTVNYTLPPTYSSAKIIVTDKTGKTIREVNISGSGKGSVNIDASTLASAVYNYSLYVNEKLIGTKQMVLAK